MKVFIAGRLKGPNRAENVAEFFAKYDVSAPWECFYAVSKKRNPASLLKKTTGKSYYLLRAHP